MNVIPSVLVVIPSDGELIATISIPLSSRHPIRNQAVALEDGQLKIEWINSQNMKEVVILEDDIEILQAIELLTKKDGILISEFDVMPDVFGGVQAISEQYSAQNYWLLKT